MNRLLFILDGGAEPDTWRVPVLISYLPSGLNSSQGTRFHVARARLISACRPDCTVQCLGKNPVWLLFLHEGWRQGEGERKGARAVAGLDLDCEVPLEVLWVNVPLGWVIDPLPFSPLFIFSSTKDSPSLSFVPFPFVSTLGKVM